MRVYLGTDQIQFDFEHARYPGGLELPIERGSVRVIGSTACNITTNDDMMITGTSWCSAEDTFCKEKGRKVALTNALRKGGFTREQRKVIWDAYHQRS